jgi:two-component system, LytTR family, sensor kinase
VAEGITLRNPVFVNTLGHTSGLLLFAVLVFLLLKSRDRTGSRPQTSTVLAALIALLWNAGSLIGMAFTQRNGQVPEWLVAINFSLLSLLPAILLSVITKRRYPWAARLGYVISACAVALHFSELPLPSERLHECALLLVTAGFGAVLIVLLALSWKTAPRIPSLTGALCLLLFTSSFLHFGYGHARTAWTSEVAWHHAGIPLALIVLLRDYRLLLLEAFIRFLANLGLAALFAGALYWANESGQLLAHAEANAFLAALLLMLLCCSLVVFAYLRSLMQKSLTTHVFQRGDLNLCSKQILKAASEAQTEQELLERCAAHIGGFVQAERFELLKLPTATRTPMALTGETLLRLPLRFSRGDSLTLVLGPRHGSRRYLREDLDSLQFLAGLTIEQVERLRTNELQKLAREAELRALQAQVNPHFLFNALNTLYGTISRESFQARRLVLNLAELFRSCLQRGRTLIPLSEELQIVQAYLEIESLRLGDRLSFEISADEAARHASIPALSIQPLVENAIKHGISRLTSKGLLRVRAEQTDGLLQVSVYDNGPGFEPGSAAAGLGMGLDNVRRRLRLCFGPSSDLRCQSDRQGSLVTLHIPVDSASLEQCAS